MRKPCRSSGAARRKIVSLPGRIQGRSIWINPRVSSMPLLPLEPFVHTVDLLPTPSQASQALGSWWVLHTRPRAEKALARKLLALRQDFFLPLYQKRLRIRGRSLTSYVPLFPGYVFLRGDAAARLE